MGPEEGVYGAVSFVGDDQKALVKGPGEAARSHVLLPLPLLDMLVVADWHREQTKMEGQPVGEGRRAGGAHGQSRRRMEAALGHLAILPTRFPYFACHDGPCDLLLPRPKVLSTVDNLHERMLQRF